jgi:cardiolipin synthase
LTPALQPLQARQGEEIEKLKRNGALSCRKIVELASQNSLAPLTTYNQVELLQNAQEKYPCLMEDLKAAKHYIHLEYYIWASDNFTEKLKDILLEKVKEGVEVRLLYDPIGSFSDLSFGYIRTMRRGGVKMYPYSPLYMLHTIGYRNHRKIAIIDGKIGYTGGLNISQEHLDGPRGFSSWRDTHLRLTGEIVRVLQASFVTIWYNTTGESLSNDDYFPPVEESSHYLPIQLINSGPDSQWEAVKQLYFFMIMTAEEHVYIQSPFFILDEAISDALQAAALSGVDVKVMVAPRGPGNQLPYWAGRTYIQEMAKAGVRIFFYQKGYFHAKTISIDGSVCTIGSSNMDIRSFVINYEASAVIYDERITRQLEEDFLEDLNYCTEFSLEEYRRRNVFFRLRDSLARLFSPLL